MDIYNRKNADYQNSFHVTVQRYGLIAALVRISDKLQRIQNLMSGKKRMVIDESLKDSIGDLATYCIMTGAECLIQSLAKSGDPPDDNVEIVNELFEVYDQNFHLPLCEEGEELAGANEFFSTAERSIISPEEHPTYGIMDTYNAVACIAIIMMRWYVKLEEDEKPESPNGCITLLCCD